MRLLTHMSLKHMEFRHTNIIIIRGINKNKLGLYGHENYEGIKETLDKLGKQVVKDVLKNPTYLDYSNPNIIV